MATVRQKIQSEIDAAQKALDADVTRGQERLDAARDKLNIFSPWLDKDVESVREAVVKIFGSL